MYRRGAGTLVSGAGVSHQSGQDCLFIVIEPENGRCRSEGCVSICDKVIMEKKILEQYNFDVIKILKKYEIENLEKLDQILFEQKVW